MKYDFDKIIERRGTNCNKWDLNQQLFGTDDVLDMWVADMDFPCPEPVVQAVIERAKHPIYGYSFPPASLYEAIIERTERYYGWEIRKEWIVFTSGIVDGFYTAIESLTDPGDEVIIQPPVYYPFSGAIRNAGAHIASNPLIFDGKRYVMDYEGFEELFRVYTGFPAKTPRIKAFLLCSPHNPVGRVWTKEELEKVAEICLRHNCVIISDEIHCDILMPGVKHISTATLSPEVEQNTITFMAGSKTFNLAGLRTGYAIIPNPVLRKKFVETRAMRPEGNMFGYAALEAAYRYADDYLEQLREYLAGNIRLFVDYINQNIPGVTAIEPEGTYLVWVDFRGLGMDDLALQNFIRFKARIAVDDGYAFGKEGSGFARFNLACPRSMVKEALSRLEQAVASLK